ncbi:MAG: RNA-protein complex protein Nop10 [Methanotrichaceae archaeon]|nr:RNA-protein complex protein Nop10 [Methanotrichaceae archaeon]
MKSKILKCPVCAGYTLATACPKCGATAITSKPARFSPVDPYGKYRRALKKEAG